MQIVIDIPEETYKRTKFYHEFRDLNDCVIVLKAIDNAVPLSKVLNDINVEINTLVDADMFSIGDCFNIIDKHLKGDGNEDG